MLEYLAEKKFREECVPLNPSQYYGIFNLGPALPPLIHGITRFYAINDFLLLK